MELGSPKILSYKNSLAYLGSAKNSMLIDDDFSPSTVSPQKRIQSGKSTSTITSRTGIFITRKSQASTPQGSHHNTPEKQRPIAISLPVSPIMSPKSRPTTAGPQGQRVSKLWERNVRGAKTVMKGHQKFTPKSEFDIHNIVLGMMPSAPSSPSNKVVFKPTYFEEEESQKKI